MPNFRPMAPLRISAGGVRMHRARLGAEGRAHFAGGGARRHAQDLGPGGDGGKCPAKMKESCIYGPLPVISTKKTPFITCIITLVTSYNS